MPSTSSIGILVPLYLIGFSSKREIQTDITIDASAETMWKQLVAFGRFPEWNLFIKSATGPLVEGEQLQVTIHPPGGDPMDFVPEQLVVRPDEELRWRGRVLVPRLFDGEHYYRIEPTSKSSVRFVLGEVFRGILAVLLWSSVEPGTRTGFEATSSALKALCEQG